MQQQHASDKVSTLYSSTWLGQAARVARGLKDAAVPIDLW